MPSDLVPGVAPGRSARALVWRRWWPLPVFALTVAVSGFSISLGFEQPPLAVLLGLATYPVASRVPKRLSVPTVLGAGVVIGCALWSAALIGRPHEPVATLALEGFLPLLAAWFVGDAAAARRQHQAALAEQAEREGERLRQEVREQRVRIAQELHDVVAHSLAVITVQAGVGRRLMAKRPEEASRALESIEAIGRTAHGELQLVLDLLREGGTSGGELSPAPRLVDVKGLVETVRASGIEIDLATSGTDRQLWPALELTLYRVIQEALTNVVRHAPGARVIVEVVVSQGTVRVEVSDEGSPVEAKGTAGGGHGLVGMRERVAAFGGSLVAEPLRPDGFRVVAEVPIKDA